MTHTSTFTSPSDGLAIALRTWGEDLEAPRGVVQIAHGVSEHGGRYDRFARALVADGWKVVAVDHRGHGLSVDAERPLGRFDFSMLIADVVDLGKQLRLEHRGTPVVLFGHSMGSFASQAAMLDASDVWSAVVLSGSSAVDVLLNGMMEQAAANPDAAGLEAFNAGFEHRTGFEWLSRDPAEVDAYVADPLSGFEVEEASMYSIFGGSERLADAEALAEIRSDLPVLITSGTADPLAGEGHLLELLGQRYQEAGLQDVTVALYPEARHELLNETNRDEVTSNIIGWLDTHVPAQA